jgi:hypothetical protein
VFVVHKGSERRRDGRLDGVGVDYRYSTATKYMMKMSLDMIFLCLLRMYLHLLVLCIKITNKEDRNELEGGS